MKRSVNARIVRYTSRAGTAAGVVRAKAIRDASDQPDERGSTVWWARAYPAAANTSQ